MYFICLCFKFRYLIKNNCCMFHYYLLLLGLSSRKEYINCFKNNCQQAVDTAARTARNPQDGSEVAVPASKRVSIKAAAPFKRAVKETVTA